MKKATCACLLGAAFLINAPVFAENRAVNVNVASIGGALDDVALRKARKVIAQAIADGIVDTFIVYSPRAGEVIQIEGGLSACAEVGFSSTQSKFDAFVKKLRSIPFKKGTSFNTEIVKSCTVQYKTAFKHHEGKIKVLVCSRGCYQYLLEIDGKLYFPDIVPDNLKSDGQSVVFDGTSLLTKAIVKKPSSNDSSVFDFEAQRIHIEEMKLK